MKQHITKEQWDELNEDQKDRLQEFFEKDGHLGTGSCPTCGHNQELNIGQMIEFLGNYWLQDYMLSFKGVVVMPDCLNPDYLCDTLWKKVKEKLNK